MPVYIELIASRYRYIIDNLAFEQVTLDKAMKSIKHAGYKPVFILPLETTC